MWLLLCASNDHPALWAVARLRARGVSPFLVLTPELLLYSFDWEHRLGPLRSPSVAFTLADGRRIRGEEVRGVLNRLSALPGHVVSHFRPGDRAYVLQEWTALHASWLAALPVPVLNLPGKSGLAGALRHPSEWNWLAAQAGLQTAPFRCSALPDDMGSRGPELPAADAIRTVFAVEGDIVSREESQGELAGPVRDRCARLARLGRTRLLGMHLEYRTNRFLGATPHPDLRAGGDRLIAAIERSLTGRG